ncbi:MAG: GTPase HflX [Bacteroidia bacterium]|nr:GTPase HflX [Bacteroidia bacterium]
MIETNKPPERAILVGIIYPGQDEREAEDFLEELSFLTETAGAEPVKRFIQKLDVPNPRTFVGSGKIDEIAIFVKENNVDMAIFDDELSPSQLRNIEETLDCRILDRTNLILDIFARRARTSHARTQVELAQYQYLLPRLTGLWTHLERQRGGIGLRGPGETEIETDRRIIRDRISLLKTQLKKIDNETLRELKSFDKPLIIIFNKMDAFTYIVRDQDDLTPVQKENYSLSDLKKTWMSSDKHHQTVFISAKTKENVEELRKLLYEEVKKIHTKRYPYNDFLYETPPTP